MTAWAVIQVKPGIGDTIWHLPFVRAIAAAAPESKVTFLAPPSSLARELFAAEPAISEVLYFAHGGNEIVRALNLLRLARLLRQNKFRRVYILDRTTRAAVAARLAGIPERIGLGLGLQRIWITNSGIDQKYFHDHPIGWLTQLMAAENLQLTSTEPDLAVPRNALAEIDAQFGALPRPWLVLALGASHPSRDWPDGHWRSLMSKLTESSRPSVILIGGPQAHARAERLIAETRVNAVNACNLSIIQCAALLKRADLFAGPDSGPMNLAAAVGTETYGLFGLNPSLDYSRHIHVVRAGDDPSLRKTIDQITPDQLFSVLKPRLAALSR